MKSNRATNEKTVLRMARRLLIDPLVTRRTMLDQSAHSKFCLLRHKERLSWIDRVGFTILLLVTLISITQSSTASNISSVTIIELKSDLLLARIKAFWECKVKTIYVDKSILDNALCPMTFDGWVCWFPVEAGILATETCGLFDRTSEHVRSASRRCNANATWEDEVNAVETTNDGERIVNHPCAPATSDTQIFDDETFWLAISATGDLGLEHYPYGHSEIIEREYENCVLTTLAKPIPNGDVSYCPRTFDGWSCWNDTQAGHVAEVHCPVHMGFDRSRQAHKVCTVNGTWFRHPDNGKIWSNYTTCVDKDDLDFRNKIINLHITGYSISVTALTISLMVFFVFKSLKCGRVTIHKNLFFSFIISNTLWIIWYTTVALHPVVMHENHIPCQMLHVLLQYFMVSNYFWMFCEGFYLHTLLVLAFVAEVKIMRWLYVIGWGVPLILTIIYTSVRSTIESAAIYCWIEEHSSLWILNVPVCLSMFLNFSFLINIVRVLVTKLRAVNSPDSNHTRKAVRATLILIPLLGLHYVIIPFRPDPRSPGERVYETTGAIVTSFQGFCVALLFCFFNGEVIALVRKRWKQEIMMRQKDRRTSYAATTISFAARPFHLDDGNRFTPSPVRQKLMSAL